jgi:hypothetical protein
VTPSSSERTAPSPRAMPSSADVNAFAMEYDPERVDSV